MESLNVEHLTKSNDESRRRGRRSNSKLLVKRNLPTTHIDTTDDHLVLWRRPLLTGQYFCFECMHFTRTALRRAATTLRHRQNGVILCLIILGILCLPNAAYTLIRRCLYWSTLGVLSSIGLGSGLHTFVLYLGPHMAKVTLAAYECNSVQFPAPPYPNEITCAPPRPSSATADETLPPPPGVSDIMRKVWFDAFLWALGTAAGELPPFLFARRRHSIIPPKQPSTASGTFFENCQYLLQNAVARYGFWTIFACACVPNPLFDLASMTCGNFGMPVWKFCLATALGKAGVKITAQILFVVVAFSQHHHYEHLLQTLRRLMMPLFGQQIYEVLDQHLTRQKRLLHFPTTNVSSTLVDGDDSEGGLWLVTNGLNLLVSAMIGYFAVTVINSMAQDGYRRHQSVCRK